MKNYYWIIFLLLNSFPLSAQIENQLIKENAPNVFINCWFCDMNYIKEQIPVINYVNDRKESDIELLFTSRVTGAGGNEYIIYFYGNKIFEGITDTIIFYTSPSESQDIIRTKIVNAIKLGLVRYLAKTPIAEKLIISFKAQPEEKTITKDDWDYWVFRAGLNGNISGQERNKYYYFNGSMSASRTTEELKLLFRVYNSYNERNFKFDSPDGEIKYTSISRSQNFKAYSYFAIDNHWSWGIEAEASKSTYLNIDYSFNISPAIEFNVFPYSESNKRQLRIAYQISPTFNRYLSETIFFKTKEFLTSQELNADFTLIESWGTTNISLSGANYFQDMSKYELQFYTSLSWQLFKGFSFSVYGGYSKIRNQIYLPRAGATYEEVLLQRKQLETGYSYWGGFGISFTFGSIYNNIVNPRFGSGGGSTIIISD